MKTESNRSNKVILYASVMSLLVIPFGNVLVVHQFELLSTLSNVLFILTAIISLPILLISSFKYDNYKHLKDWSKLYWLFIAFDVGIFLCNKIPGLSAMSNLGYIHMAPFDIILRTVTMLICFKLIYKWLQGAYPLEMHASGKVIVTTFATTQIILFSIAAWGNYFALVR